MFTHLKKIIISTSILLLFVAACNFPGRNQPSATTATPNLTLTALFNPTNLPPTQQPTQAPPPTEQPTAVPPQPTQIPVQPTQPPQQPAPVATATPTSTPTKTAVPTVSYAGPSVRPGPSMTAKYLSKAPNIDGVFDEWNADRFAVDAIVAGSKQWDGNADASAMVMLGWDEDFLYIAARVKDDTYVQRSTGDQIFKGDSIEILVDNAVAPDFKLQSLNGDDYQLGMSPGRNAPGNSPEAYLWYPKALSGSQQKVKIGSTTTSDGYRIEVKVPWSVLGISNPGTGKHYGFAFSVSDDDKSGSAVQQSLVSNVGTRVLTDPTTWGDLTLIGGSTSETTPTTRTAASLTATFVSSAPTIDGNLADWAGTPSKVTAVVYGKENWSGAGDLSGEVRLAWDANNLYIAATVTDNKYVQGATRQELFKGDSLEIQFDTNLLGDFFTHVLNSDDVQIGISPGSSPGINPEAYQWEPADAAGRLKQVKIGAITTTEGYQVEAAIPWSVIGISPAKNQHYGFVFSISDNDNAAKNVQQTMVSNDPSRSLTDPTTWGDLLLVK
jgi:hypothetical protein